MPFLQLHDSGPFGHKIEISPQENNLKTWSLSRKVYGKQNGRWSREFPIKLSEN
jgi:hypothetical protein